MAITFYQLIVFYWLTCTIIISILGMLAIWAPKKSELTMDLVCFGKFRKDYNFKRWLRLFELPKRLFWTFYLIACTATVLAFTYVSVNYAVYKGHLFSTLFGLTLYFTHVSRRLYECLYLSIFSDSKINILHFLLGMTFYPICICSQILSFSNRSGMNSPSAFSSLIFIIVLATAAIIVQQQQHNCFAILASLRSYYDPATVNLHQIPYGGLFEYCSSPHYFLEIVLYFLLAAIYEFSSPMLFCLLFVIANQSVAAFLNHNWYKRHFHDYPTNRTALIPYVL